MAVEGTTAQPAGGTGQTGGVSTDMLASLERQNQLQKQNMIDQMAQTEFQDKKNRQNEALKAISDAVNDNYKARLDQIRNMKTQ